jgi:hypothetical protein
MEWTVISAVNNESVLKSNLLQSPGIKSASEVILQRGFSSAALAYNAAMRKAATDLLVFAHQDMYFPGGWIESVMKAMETLSGQDPDWGVLGVWGAVDSRQPVGCLWWTGDLGWKNPFEGGKEVVSLDEVVLIFRKSSGLVFDDRLPGYHMYGADICTEARSRGKKCYAISALCIHNTNTERFLPLQFWKCYWFVRRKWKERLPINTPCIQISFWCWPIIHWHLVSARDVALGRRKRLLRVENPAVIHGQLMARGVVRRAVAPAQASAHPCGQ